VPAKKKTIGKKTKDEESDYGYMVISRNGTNPLTVAVVNAMKDGYVPTGGVTISSELKGREKVTTYHQAMCKY
tara:strand:- start:302 stop:520 length:219 start_codon:yes stop_codon:yes gene_type:complete